MRPAEEGDLISELERELADLYAASLPRCAMCGVPIAVAPDGNKPVVCSMDCALELARREEKRP